MKHTTQILLLVFLTVIFFSSCEKVVDVDLKDAEPKLVIEAYLSDQNINHIVRISKTISFNNSNQFNGLSGAQVVLRIPGGQQITFTETQAGIYHSPKFAGIPGSKYDIDVTVEGKVYTATSVMPLPVILDSLSFKKISFFGEEEIFPVAHYKDPKDVQNQYLFMVKARNEEPEDILIEDRFTNGNDVTESLFTGIEDLAEGNSIQVEMRVLDRNVYKYFFAIAQISGEGGPPVSPANPLSNFNNGAIGVFSAYTTTTLTKVVKLN
ncbi:DUF4249 domain-containing protein [Pedobacter sp. P351]|uniref:DUF4249 domain-containing protein n=1 Tax=Pedobacter superstes TaxID=3133441 RepID=UPI0030AC9BA7